MGEGSGTIISPQGHVLTNWHVILDDDHEPFTRLPILVTDPAAPDQQASVRYVAALVAYDADDDIALLQIVEDLEGNTVPADVVFPSVPLGSTDAILIGDPVFVVGYPAVSGYTITFTTGVISGFLGEDGVQGGRRWIKTDAQFARGNSGGGAFDTYGTLVGVPTIRQSLDSAVGPEVQNLLRPVDVALPLLQKHVAGLVVVEGPSVGAAPQPPVAQGPEGTAAEPSLPVGATWIATGALDAGDVTHFPGRYAHPYEIGLMRGASVRVQVASQYFDPYLIVLDPSGSVILDVDDSPGAGVNVDEVFTPRAEGVHTLIVTSAYRFEQGSYTLRVDGDLASVPFLSSGQHHVERSPADSPADETGFGYSGTWEGTISDSVEGTGTIRVLLSQLGSTILGTWEATFPSGRVGGTLSGSVQSAGVVLEAHPSDPDACPFRSAVETSGLSLTGRYVAFDCSIPVSGVLSIFKQ